MPDGSELIRAERQRQIDVEGWTPEHDDQHANAELVGAARAYCWAAFWAIRNNLLKRGFGGDRLIPE